MPMWKNIHAFPRYVEERALAEWTSDKAVREAVLAVADALLELVESHELAPHHVQAFLRSANLTDSDPRAWRPGCIRLLQSSRIFPDLAGGAVRSLLDEPVTAARLLASCHNDVQLSDAEREQAFKTLLSAPPETRISALQGDALRSVRIEAQRREAERSPRRAEDVLRDLALARDDVPEGLRRDLAGFLEED